MNYILIVGFLIVFVTKSFSYFDQDYNFGLQLQNIQNSFKNIKTPLDYDLVTSNVNKHDTLYTYKLRGEWKKFAFQIEPYQLFKALMPMIREDPKYVKPAIVVLCARYKVESKYLIYNDNKLFTDAIISQIVSEYMPYSEVEYLIKNFGDSLEDVLKTKWEGYSRIILKSYFNEKSKYYKYILNVSRCIDGSWFDDKIVVEKDCLYVWLVEILIRAQKGYDGLYAFISIIKSQPQIINQDMFNYITSLIKTIGWYKEYNTLRLTQSSINILEYLINNKPEETEKYLKILLLDNSLNEVDKEYIRSKMINNETKMK